jgi:Protein of unknown function (DUF3108)
MTTSLRTLRKLALLTGVVVWVHGLMLVGLPQSIGWLQTVQSPSVDSTTGFLTRSVAAPAPAIPITPTVSAIRPRPKKSPPSAPVAPPKATPAAPTPAAPAPQTPAIESTTNLEPSETAPLVDIAQAATENIAKNSQPSLPEPPPIQSDAESRVVAAASTLPAPVRIKYNVKGEVKGFPYFANGELLWRQDGKTYDARLEISHFLLGSRVQTSKGLISSQGLEPIRFGDKVRSEVAAHFERSKGKVIFSANTPEVALLPGAQDHLSVLLQISILVGSDPARYTRGTQLAFQAIGPRSAENWVFTAGELEEITLQSGEIRGLKFTRPSMGEFEPRLEVWFGPDVGYLPVRVRLTQSNGDFVDQLWRTTQKP